MLNARLDGHLCEIQLHLDVFLEIKSSPIGHAVYKCAAPPLAVSLAACRSCARRPPLRTVTRLPSRLLLCDPPCR